MCGGEVCWGVGGGEERYPRGGSVGRVVARVVGECGGRRRGKVWGRLFLEKCRGLHCNISIVLALQLIVAIPN